MHSFDSCIALDEDTTTNDHGVRNVAKFRRDDAVKKIVGKFLLVAEIFELKVLTPSPLQISNAARSAPGAPSGSLLIPQ